MPDTGEADSPTSKLFLGSVDEEPRLYMITGELIAGGACVGRCHFGNFEPPTGNGVHRAFADDISDKWMQGAAG